MSEHWREVERLFFAALEIPAGAEREAFLTAADIPAAVRDEVRDLLLHHSEKETLAGIDTLAERLAGGPVEERDFPDRVGPYRIVSEIGRGGMGRVFLALREDLPKRVALKFARGVLGAPDRIARFDVERSILARLEHPSIAQLMDAGVTDDGTPYFAMEYVEGTDLMTHCDERRLSVRERLRLFVETCSAVAYAHAMLVVHRDLKPSNVLVTPDGRVKLLDFGVAKLIEESEATQTGPVRFTPSYASPEQLAGDRVAVASDVYQLGVLLYELLCGETPFDFAGMTPAQAGRLLSTRDPTAPSISAGSAAALRGTTAGGLRRQLAEVDAVVMRALEPAVSDRYASVEALRADVTRYLQGYPVEARKHSRWGRARKFVSRHKVGSAATAVIAIYAASLTGAIWQTVKQRNEAQRQTARAEATKGFLVDLFQQSNPVAGEVAPDLTAVDLVRRGADDVERLRSTPDLYADLSVTLGSILSTLGAHAYSDSLLANTLAFDDSLRVLHPDRRAEAHLMRAELHYLKDDTEESLALYQEVVDDRSGAGDRDALRLRALSGVASVFHQTGRREAADSINSELERLITQGPIDPDPHLASLLLRQGQVRMYSGDLDRAERSLEATVQMNRQLYDFPHPNIGIALMALGTRHSRAGEWGRGVEALEESLSVLRRAHPNGDASAVSTLSALGVAYDRVGRPAEAIATLNEAEQMSLVVHGDEHPMLAQIWLSKARYYERSGDSETALELFQRSEQWWRDQYGSEYLVTLAGSVSVGGQLRRMGRLDEAEEVLLRTFEAFERTRGLDDPRIQSCVRALVALYDDWGRGEEADRYRALLASPESG